MRLAAVVAVDSLEFVKLNFCGEKTESRGENSNSCSCTTRRVTKLPRASAPVARHRVAQQQQQQLNLKESANQPSEWQLFSIRESERSGIRFSPRRRNNFPPSFVHAENRVTRTRIPIEQQQQVSPAQKDARDLAPLAPRDCPTNWPTCWRANENSHRPTRKAKTWLVCSPEPEPEPEPSPLPSPSPLVFSHRILCRPKVNRAG